MRKTIREMEAEREKSMRRVFMPKNKYGFEVNIQNPILRNWYDSYKLRKKIHGAFANYERLKWEETVKSYIKAEYEKMYNEPYFCHTTERVEELVQRLGVKTDKKL